MTDAAQKEGVVSLMKEFVSIFNQRWENPEHNNAQLEDFERKRTLGTGAFGRVLLVRHKQTEQFYALKVLDKHQIYKQKQVEHVINEKRILEAISFPFIVKLDFSFQDNANLFIGLEFVGGGEMFTYLRKVGHFTEVQSKLYACQVILAFEYLQSLDIMHRDLKPENLLIDPTGNIKMTDFGFAKKVKGRTYTLCGTPEYIAPEIIQNKGYNHSVDWWSTGILIYEMTAGHPPFYASEHISIYEKITAGKFKFPKFFSSDLRDLLDHMIQKDLTRRYGNLVNGVEDIKKHSWFHDVNWLAVLEKKVPPPFVPHTKGAGDSSNFDAFDEQPLKTLQHDKYEREFRNF